jgi:hypothetical protein
MSQNRFQEAKRIYSSALEREPEQQAAYLDQACAGDAQLRKEYIMFDPLSAVPID